MQRIAHILNGSIHYLKSYEGHNMVVNLSKLNITINYFKKYSLKTKKILSFQKWLIVYKKIIKKEHLLMTETQLTELKLFVKTINKFDILLEKIESDQLCE